MIEVHEVSKFFGNVVAVSDVSCTIEPGVTALLGPNGAGKSTLFRMLCGLTPPSRGTLRVLGADPRRDRDVRGRIGLVPQQGAVRPLVGGRVRHGGRGEPCDGRPGSGGGSCPRCRRPRPEQPETGRRLLEGHAPA
ncbi:MAG: ATP-binding cassette domain-containing protein [Ilumatobacteraceae bacterium]